MRRPVVVRNTLIALGTAGLMANSLLFIFRVTIGRRITDMTKEMDILVHTLATYPEMNNPIKMEVGIEECLHIEFEYNKSK